ncbi:hypothetical protein L3Q82_005544 [Scortum barcoo]|uniref:Uncharacterized protein n=1 Tax=Scortum barcoo TaxID=214431 RepID=A0ACB8VBH4_9TELE|nr:hypothetical protein L3Q82_005544 [Scortum barcoo]
MVLDRKRVVCPLRVGGEVLPQVEEFKYLGVLFTSEGKMEHEIDRFSEFNGAKKVASGSAEGQSSLDSFLTKPDLVLAEAQKVTLLAESSSLEDDKDEPPAKTPRLFTGYRKKSNKKDDRSSNYNLAQTCYPVDMDTIESALSAQDQKLQLHEAQLSNISSGIKELTDSHAELKSGVANQVRHLAAQLQQMVNHLGKITLSRPAPSVMPDSASSAILSTLLTDPPRPVRLAALEKFSGESRQLKKDRKGGERGDDTQQMAQGGDFPFYSEHRDTEEPDNLNPNPG